MAINDTTYKKIMKLLSEKGIEFDDKHGVAKCPQCKTDNLVITEDYGLACVKCKDNKTLEQFMVFEINSDINKVKELISSYCIFQEPKKRSFVEAIKYFTDMKDMAEQFIKIQPIYYDKARLWWLWNHNKCMWEMIDEVDLLNKVDEALREVTFDTAKISKKNEIVEVLKRIGRLNAPQELPTEFIQFENILINIFTEETIESTPEFFSTNPIPYPIGESEDTPVIDKLFSDWVGIENKKLLYEIVAYTLYQDYPIHRIFCFNGSGSNGKSSFLNLLRDFIGKENCTSADLEFIMNSRFERSKLYRKLACFMSETNFSTVKRTSKLKELCGNDLIDFEYKGKQGFADVNYAKIIIATNSLPMTLDKTQGFYRRWTIIDFPNQFDGKTEVISKIPKIEFSNLALKCIRILKEILEKREFTNEGDIDDRMKKYEELSNPLAQFIKEKCIKEGELPFNELKEELDLFLQDRGHRVMTANEVGRKLSVEGFDRKNKKIGYTSVRVVTGLSWKNKKKGVDFLSRI